MWILFYKTTSFLARILPRKIALFITERLAEGAYFVAFKRARPIAIKNLSFALKGLKTEHEVKFMILEQFKNFAGFIYDFLLLPYMDERKLGSMYKMIGFHKLREAFKEGKGVVILTGHLGNWELGASALAHQNVPVTAVVMPHPTPMVTRFFDSTRVSKGVNIVPVERAARLGLRTLLANECLAILSDRDFTGTGTEIDFLGAKAVFPVGGVRLAAKADATICPAFSIRSKNGNYKIYFEDTYKVQKLADGSPDIDGALNKWAGILGKYIRLFPTQWYLFEAVWHTK